MANKIPFDSVFIFDDPDAPKHHGKARLVQHSENWFSCEWKPLDDETPWQPYIFGHKDWLGLTEQEIKFSKPSKEYEKARKAPKTAG